RARSPTWVARLRAAGAICLGKTNLDQFATGLVGVRTPYPAPRNAIDPALVPGGSSSGSAVAVAQGLVAFSLGTDTAGSGRVPAALNDIVGLKPSLGALSSAGMVPACRTLDTISIFAHSVAEAWELFTLTAAFDPADAWSRPLPPPCLAALPAAVTVAVPDAASLRTFGDTAQAAHFHATVERLRAQGAQVREIDLSPFYAVAELLYSGPWVAERVAAVGSRLTTAPETLHEVTRAILAPGLALSAADAFNGLYRLQELRRVCAQALEGADFLCVPTIPCFVTLDEIAADPFGPNSRLGTYTNFVNLLGWSAIAIPASQLPDGLPFGITLIAPGWREPDLVRWAQQLEAQANLCAGVTGLPAQNAGSLPAWRVPTQGETIEVAVVGAHLRGMPLNHELLACGARFREETSTASDYRLYALQGTVPPKPGMARSDEGAAITVEVWDMPIANFGRFVAGVPTPLGIGSVQLQDGRSVEGFICEGHALTQARDITAFGGWRAYLASLGAAPR
ncbi:MAG: allophanate hydrolase, partial [Achromobacter sp.]|nr:allophanate hydrolase [Achromobacter sp.]